MSTESHRRGHPLWWTAGLVLTVVTAMAVCSALFAGAFTRHLSVTLTSERTGLVMESGSKVTMRGVEVGRVSGMAGGQQVARVHLEIFPDQVHFIPANVGAEIKATTAFGAKYVELLYPHDPTAERLASGAVLESRNVSTEVNTVFDNLVELLRQVDVPKLSAILTALADGVRGQGPRMGEATTAASRVLSQINPRMDTVAEDWRSFAGFSDAYSAAAQDIISTLDAATTVSATITERSGDLDALLLNTIGFARSGTELLAPNLTNFVDSINVLEPTTALLLKYNPIYTCTVQGAKVFLDTAGNEWFGGDGRTVFLDAGIAMGDDLYRYPQNLPLVAAKGGPGGKPGCGSLPDVTKNFPVRQLVTNTGWGTGLDWRPNPGIGRTCAVDYFPVTRGVPEQPHVGECLPGPAPGPPPPWPGGPPYGAPWYGPGGEPLWPGVPPAPAVPPSPAGAESPAAP